MSQTTDTVLMVRPANFQFNAETAANNSFQEDIASVQGLALTEFDMMAQKLRDAGIHVVVVSDTPKPIKPDAIFPNNWFSTHPDGTLVLYPMFAMNRRQEVRRDVVEYLESTLGYEIRNLLDLTSYADNGHFLEGTGSLVLDRVHGIAYACLSERTEAELLKHWATQLGYTPCLFRAVDREGQDIYHTNVMMSVGKGFAIVCSESIANEAERKQVTDQLKESGHELIDISLAQVYDMVGNMLLLHNNLGENILVLSRRAYDALLPEQAAQLMAYCKLLPVDITHIEIAGGGSARCMLAEVFLPRQ